MGPRAGLGAATSISLPHEAAAEPGDDPSPGDIHRALAPTAWWSALREHFLSQLLDVLLCFGPLGLGFYHLSPQTGR